MSLFGALYVGTSGLQTSQEALNVVAHNITNADTEGYVRQQVAHNTREYNKLSVDITGVSQKQTGLGVYVGEVRQVRDRFVDESYREEYGREGFYETSYAAIEEVEEILGELDGAVFYETLNNFWNSIEELVKDPSSEVCQSMLVQYAQSFCEASSNVYGAMADYQDKLNFNVKNDVDRINEIGHKIFKLNEAIRGIEAGGIEHANDLKDQRNQLLDELSNLTKMSYEQDYFGNTLVKIEGHDFVAMDKVNDLNYVADDEGFYFVFWPDSAPSTVNSEGKRVYDADVIKHDNNALVYNLDQKISSAADTDLGALKSVLLARGDHRGNWTDLQDEASYKKVSESIMMNIMAEFDGLVRNVVTAVNEVLANNSNPATGYLMAENGEPIQLFHRINCESTDAEDVKRDSTWFSAENIVVNQDLMQYPTHLGFMKPDGSVDYVTAKDLETAFQTKKYVLNPSLTNPIDITEYYSNLVAQLSNSGNIYKNLKDNQLLTVGSIESTRQGSIGVSTDEELSNMIRFQNAYNASSRFINVINECTEHIINTLGS